jgi:tRNA G26 N,N-dimethylase Trm1
LITVGERCPYCQKFRNPREILWQPGGVRICVECEQRHIQAVEALSTMEYHGVCTECGKGPASEENRELVVHYENGKYRIMCLPCDLAYVPKRLDLYGGTQFARERGLN